jgi:hypothetical protein
MPAAAEAETNEPSGSDMGPEAASPSPALDDPDFAETAETPAGSAAGAGSAGGAAAEAAVPVMQPLPAGPAMPEIPSGLIRPREARPTGPITVPPKMPPVERPKRRGLRGLLLLLGILVGLLAVAFFLRDMIARTIPGAEELYTLAGIQTGDPAEDLEISNVKIVKRDINAKQALEISGDIFNISKYPVRAPVLQAIPKDKDGKALSPSHSFRLEQPSLEPGETVSFRTVYEDLPESTASVTVNFAE